jgi:hypothetical protein
MVSVIITMTDLTSVSVISPNIYDVRVLTLRDFIQHSAVKDSLLSLGGTCIYQLLAAPFKKAAIFLF